MRNALWSLKSVPLTTLEIAAMMNLPLRTTLLIAVGLASGLATAQLGSPSAAKSGQHAAKRKLSGPSKRIQALLDAANAEKLGWQKRLGLYMAILRKAKAKRDLFGQSLALYWIGRCYDETDQLDLAVQYYTLAIPVARSAGDRASLGKMLNNIGSIKADQGHLAEAAEYLNRSLMVATEVGNSRGAAATENTLGRVYRGLGKNQDALNHFKVALALSTSIHDREGQGVAYGNMGRTYGDLGLRQKAVEVLSSAFSIWKELDDEGGQAIALINLGVVYLDLNNNDKALEVLKSALIIFQKTKDKTGEAHSRNDIAQAFANQRKSQQALEQFQLALALEKEDQDWVAMVDTLNNLGQVYLNQGKILVAEEQFQTALRLAKSGGTPDGVALSLANIGTVYAKNGDRPKALEAFGDSLRIASSVEDRDLEAEVLGEMSDQFHALGHNGPAIALGKKSINLFQSLRAEISGLGKDTQGAFRDSISDQYRNLAEVLADVGRLPEAQQVLDLLKDEEYFRYLRRGAGKSTLVDLTPREQSWLKRYDELGGELISMAIEREKLLKIAPQKRSPEQAKRLGALRDKADLAAKAFQVFLSEVDKSFSDAGASKDRLDDLKGSQALQGSLKNLPSNPAALYTLVTGDGVRIILTIPGLNAPRQAKVKINEKELSTKILKFTEVLTDPPLDPRPLGAELYDIIVRPVEKDLTEAGIQTLMWSLDGILRYVPVWALYDRVNQQYLIQKYPSSLFTPRTVARLLESPHAWTGVEFGVTKGGMVGTEKFRVLPNVAKELEGVHQALGGPRPLLDDAFTYGALRDALDTGPRVLHIATHFRFKAGDDVGSFLLLGGGGSLSVEQVREMADGSLSSVDLLVLSACETALGGSGDGSEFEGFALLAQQKGAGSVITTLWPVADESTALLMSRFYNLHKLHPGWTKLHALQAAQVEMLTGVLRASDDPSFRSGHRSEESASSTSAPPWPNNMPSFAHPFFWAPFVLTGNWK